MPEPNFKVGQNVRLGVDTFGSIPRQMEGKIVQIDRVHPFDEVNGAFFCDVHAMDRNINARVYTHNASGRWLMEPYSHWQKQ